MPTVETDNSKASAGPRLSAEGGALRWALMLLAGTALALHATPLRAEDAVKQGAPGAPVISVVTGVAADDLLNIRDSASAFGKIKGRLPNGASLKNFGCDTINGYPWCMVEQVGNSRVSGFVPGRYLRPAEGQEKADALADIADAARNAPVTDAIKPDATEPRTAEAAVAPDKDGPADKAAAPAADTGTQDKPASAAKVPTAVPVDMMARFGDPSSPPVAGAPASSSVGTAMHDAYGLAFAAAAQDKDTTGGVKAASDAGEEQASAAGDTPPDGMTEGTPAPGIPIPTPRPNRADAADEGKVALAVPAPADPEPAAPAAVAPPASATPAPAAPAEADTASAPAIVTPAPTPPVQEKADRVPEDAKAEAPPAPPAPASSAPEAKEAPAIDTLTVAQAQPAATAAPTPDATGDIPCARYVGQPMTRCQASVVRIGSDGADVTVNWPDGGARIINFRDGKPSGANSRGEFRYTREGTLNMIRVGLSERFEITDSLPFGD